MVTRALYPIAVCLAALGLAATVPRDAAAQARKPDIAPATPPPSLESAAPPYEVPLLRLAEVLGTLTYLRDLCGFNDGAEFRSRMATLLDSEAASGPRRERIAGHFNRGYREYELVHRTCTPVSREVTQRAMDEGGRLAREIGNRFGGT